MTRLHNFARFLLPGLLLALTACANKQVIEQDPTIELLSLRHYQPCREATCNAHMSDWQKIQIMMP